jgi:hypothetical protein
MGGQAGVGKKARKKLQIFKSQQILQTLKIPEKGLTPL